MLETELYGKMVDSVFDYINNVEVEESIKNQLLILMAKLAGFEVSPVE